MFGLFGLFGVFGVFGVFWCLTRDAGACAACLLACLFFCFCFYLLFSTRDAKACARSVTTTARTQDLNRYCAHVDTPIDVEQLQTLRLAHARPLLLLRVSSRGRRREACRGLVQDERPDLRRESNVLFSKSYSAAALLRPAQLHPSSL